MRAIAQILRVKEVLEEVYLQAGLESLQASTQLSNFGNGGIALEVGTELLNSFHQMSCLSKFTPLCCCLQLICKDMKLQGVSIDVEMQEGPVKYSNYAILLFLKVNTIHHERINSLPMMMADYLRTVFALNLQIRTYCIAQHCKTSQSSNGLCEVLLCIVQLLDVSADFLHHQFTLLCFPSDVIYLSK